jgi:hypothetical protein
MAKRRSKASTKETNFADLKAFFVDLGSAELSDRYDWGHQTLSYQLARLGYSEAALESALSVRQTARTVFALAQVAILLPSTPAGQKALETADTLAADGLLQRDPDPSPDRCDVAALIHMELGAARAALGDGAAAEEHFQQALSASNLLPGSQAHKDPARMVVALIRAGDADRACAVLAQTDSTGAGAESGEDEPAELANAIQLLFEEGHLAGALQLLELLREHWGFGHKGDLLAAAVRTLAADGRHGEALDLLDCPTISFGAVPHRLEVIESWVAGGEQVKEQALDRLEALLVADPDSTKAEYLLALARLAPERCSAHFSAQLQELGTRADWYARTVAAAAARLEQTEALLAVEGELRSPLARVALRIGLLGAGREIQQHVEAALTVIDDDAAMETSTARAEENREVALLDLAAALHAVDAEQASQLFERVQSAIIERGGDDKRYQLSSLLQSRAEAGDLNGALSTLMALSPAQRCSHYLPLLDAYARRGDLAGVLTVAKKLGGSDRDWERAQAVVTGFSRAARVATKASAHGPGSWPPG